MCANNKYPVYTLVGPKTCSLVTSNIYRINIVVLDGGCYLIINVKVCFA